MRLACGFDHAGEALRETVLGALRDAGHRVSIDSFDPAEVASAMYSAMG